MHSFDASNKCVRIFLGIILQLAEEDVLPAEAADVLLGFVREKDERIMSLYASFQYVHQSTAVQYVNVLYCALLFLCGVLCYYVVL